MKKFLVLSIALFVFILVSCSGPQRIKFSSCQEDEGVKTECRTFEIEGKIKLLPL